MNRPILKHKLKHRQYIVRLQNINILIMYMQRGQLHAIRQRKLMEKTANMKQLNWIKVWQLQDSMKMVRHILSAMV